jgi:hypothetical protein
MPRTILCIALLILGVMIILAGCGPKQRLSEGLMDTPEVHYNQGMRTQNMNEAQNEFQEALKLNAKFAPAWAGLSLISATRGAFISDPDSKERKNYFNEAQKY